MPVLEEMLDRLSPDCTTYVRALANFRCPRDLRWTRCVRVVECLLLSCDWTTKYVAVIVAASAMGAR
jgi:hypothetical protein